ncbi:MAG: sodium-dependent transporter [Emergencia sp.]
MSNKGNSGFNSNFGFLMAAIGSAVGLGNLWSFPYKMGNMGGFVFLICYLVFLVFVGYPMLLGEFTIGRKTQVAAIEGFAKVDKRFKIFGIIETVAPYFLVAFYCTFGGYIMKYLFASIGWLFGAGDIGTADAGEYFGSFISSGAPAILFMILFWALTVIIVYLGTAGIEKFCKFAIPALVVCMIIIIIRAVTLPGAGEGLAFIFSPSLEAFKGTGWIKVLGSAGNQCFFSLSLASGCLIAYGAGLSKTENLEKNAAIVAIADTAVAVMAGITIFPAVFAYGLEPAAGPGLLFSTLITVFQNMGGIGPIFSVIFFLLVFFAALSSSIGMMEGGIHAIVDAQEKKGKPNRPVAVAITAIIALAGNLLVTADGLGSTGLPHLLGLGTWLDFFDLFAEGILMPLGALGMAILLGWVRKGFLDDEVAQGSDFKTKKFVYFCLKYVDPIICAILLVVSLNGFFGFTTLF